MDALPREEAREVLIPEYGGPTPFCRAPQCLGAISIFGNSASPRESVTSEQGAHCPCYACKTLTLSHSRAPCRGMYLWRSINQSMCLGYKSSACVHLLEMINRTRTTAFRALLGDSVEQKKCRAKYHRITTVVTVSTKATIAKSPTST